MSFDMQMIYIFISNHVFRRVAVKLGEADHDFKPAFL